MTMCSTKENHIKEFTKKNPQWQVVFLAWVDYDNSIDISMLENSFSTFIKNKQLLSEDINIDYAMSLLPKENNKQRGFFNKLSKFVNAINHNDIVEIFDDKIQATLHLKKKEQFIKSLKTKSYKHLFNEDVDNKIHVILDNNVPIESMKHQFFNKLARIKTSTELLNSLNEFQSKNILWKKEIYLKKIKPLSAEIMCESENSLMVRVHNYEACQKLGSQAWCIVTHKHFFDDYTRDNQMQLIYFDFNLPIESNESMIGFTLDSACTMRYSHLKNDESTPYNIRMNFCFKYLLKGEILTNYLQTISNTDAFKFICKNDIVDIYDKYAHRECFRILISESFLINSPNNNSVSPTSFININSFKEEELELIYSIVNNSPLIFKKTLHDKDIDISLYINDLLRIASTRRSAEIFTKLLSFPNVEISTNDNNLLLTAISETNNLENVQLLLNDDRMDLSICHEKLLDVASLNGYTDVVKAIISLNIPVASKSLTELICQSMNCHPDITRFLFSKIKLDQKEDLIIFKYAIENGSKEFVSHFIKNNNFNKKSDIQDSIITALKLGEKHTINLLVDHDIIDISYNCYAPLKAIVAKGYDDLMFNIFNNNNIDPNVIRDILEVNISHEHDHSTDFLLKQIKSNELPFGHDLLMLALKTQNEYSFDNKNIYSLIDDDRINIHEKNYEFLFELMKQKNHKILIYLKNRGRLNSITDNKEFIIASIKCGFQELIITLLGDNPSKKIISDKNILEAAIDYESLYVVKMFLDSGMYGEHLASGELMNLAIEKNKITIVDLLLKYFLPETDNNYFINQSFDKAISDNNSLFKDMIKYNYDCDSHDVYRILKHNFTIFYMFINNSKIDISLDVSFLKTIFTEAHSYTDTIYKQAYIEYAHKFLTTSLFDMKKHGYELLFFAFEKEYFHLIIDLLYSSSIDNSFNDNYLLKSILNGTIINKKSIDYFKKSSEDLKICDQILGREAHLSQFFKNEESKKRYDNKKIRIRDILLNDVKVNSLLTHKWIDKNIIDKKQKIELKYLVNTLKDRSDTPYG